MNQKKGGFGRMLAGLGEVGDVVAPSPAPAAAPAAGAVVEGITQMIRVDRIEPDPNQPRRYFDEDALRELADSMAAEGQIQPITVRPHPDKPDHFILVVGERRWRASQLNAWSELEAKVKAPKNLRVAQLMENVQREGLTDQEIADSLADIVAEGKLNASTIARGISKSPAWVSDYLQLRSMPQVFRDALAAHTVQNIHVLAECFRLYKQYPDKVTELVAGAGPEAPVNQAAVRKLKAAMVSEDARPKGGKAKTEPADGASSTETPAAQAKALKPAPVSVRIHVAPLDGDFDGQLGAELILTGVEAKEGIVHVRLWNTNEVREVAAKSVVIQSVEYF